MQTAAPCYFTTQFKHALMSHPQTTDCSGFPFLTVHESSLWKTADAPWARTSKGWNSKRQLFRAFCQSVAADCVFCVRNLKRLLNILSCQCAAWILFLAKEETKQEQAANWCRQPAGTPVHRERNRNIATCCKKIHFCTLLPPEASAFCGMCTFFRWRIWFFFKTSPFRRLNARKKERTELSAVYIGRNRHQIEPTRDMLKIAWHMSKGKSWLAWSLYH